MEIPAIHHLGHIEELRFTISPSFEPMLSLRLLSDVEGALRTYRLECQIMGIATNAGSWEVSVGTAAAEALLADFAGQDLDRKATSSIGVDGVTYSLDFGSGPERVTLRWWSALPRQWRGLTPLLRRLLRLAGPRARGFERHLRPSQVN